MIPWPNGESKILLQVLQNPSYKPATVQKERCIVCGRWGNGRTKRRTQLEKKRKKDSEIFSKRRSHDKVVTLTTTPTHTLVGGTAWHKALPHRSTPSPRISFVVQACHREYAVPEMTPLAAMNFAVSPVASARKRV